MIGVIDLSFSRRFVGVCSMGHGVRVQVRSAISACLLVGTAERELALPGSLQQIQKNCPDLRSWEGALSRIIYGTSCNGSTV